MSELRLNAAAVIHTADQNVDDLLARFADDLKRRGVAIRGVVQRNTPDPLGGHAQMDLVDVATGNSYRISQKLGPAAGSCHLDLAGLAAASAVLRQALMDRPALIITNRFGEQEATGRGFADEMLAAMAEKITLLTMVASKWLEQWQTFKNSVHDDQTGKSAANGEPTSS